MVSNVQGHAVNNSNNNIPAGYTASTWAFQQSVDKALGINPQTTAVTSSNTQSHNTSSSNSNSSTHNNTNTANAAPKLAQYSVGNVPNTATPTNRANANAEYIDPATGQVTYYHVPNQANPVNNNNSGLSISETPAATGTNQIPSWVQSELQSGAIRSWTNPNTRQTWYAPGALGVNKSIWVSGPSYSGPLSNYRGTSYINAGGTITPSTTQSTVTVRDDGKVLYSGASQGAPHIEYTADGKFVGLLNIPTLSSPAAPFTSYQTFHTPNGTVSLPESVMDGPFIATGTWAPNTSGGFTFTAESYTFNNGETTMQLSNPTIRDLEALGLTLGQALSAINGLTGKLQLTISPSTNAAGEPSYAISATPVAGATQILNVPLPTINGATTEGVPFTLGGNTSNYTYTPTLPIVYEYNGNGVGTPIGFQSPETNGKVVKTYTKTINGKSYSFVVSPEGNIEYAPTGSTAFAQLRFNNNPTLANGMALTEATAKSPLPQITELITAPSTTSNPLESILPAVSATLNTISKPFNEYVAQPAEQAASYAASRLYPVLSTPSRSGAQVNPLMIGRLISGLPVNELTSYLHPYLNTSNKNINNFLSSTQNEINKLANTSYNPSDILSEPYWENQLGSSIKLIEQFIGHPIQTVGALPGEAAQVQSMANELVKEGAAPWYLPDVTLAMMAAPLVATGYGGVALTGGSLGGAGLLTAIGAGADYGINGLLRGQWTGPQAFQNAEAGALTAAMMAPLAEGFPLANFLASKGITGLAGQILNDIPVYGSWAALNAGLSSEAQGKVPTPAYLGENFGMGALVGAALPIGGRLLSSVVAKFLPNAIGYSIDDYIAKFGSNPQADDYIKSVIDLGGDPNDLTLYADKTTGEIAGVVYNDMHVSYDTAQEIGQYLQQVADQNGGKVILAHASPTSLPNNFNIQSAEELGTDLGGVRANAYTPGEGLYLNLPTEGNRPIWLGGYIDGENYGEPEFSLNPFANLKGTLLATETTPSNIDVETISKFLADNPDTDLSTPEGQNLLSRWLYEQAVAQGKQFGIPYQNYLPGGSEQQVMGYPGTDINTLSSQTYAFRPNEGFFAPVKFINVKMASNLPEDFIASEDLSGEPSGEPLTQEEYANLARESAATSSGTYYYTPYGAIPSSMASAIASTLLNAQGINPLPPSTYSASSSVLRTPYSVNSIPSISPSIIQSSFPSISSSISPSISPSASASPSPSESTSPYSSVSSMPSSTTSPSPSISPSSSSSSPSSSTSSSYSSSSSSSPSRSSFTYPGAMRKPLLLPYLNTYPIGAETYAHPIAPESIANIYSPSLLPLLFPEIEPEAEQSYSPLTATTTFRPLRNPTNLPLIPNTEAIPSTEGHAVSYKGIEQLANEAQPYSNMLSTIPDPLAFTKLLNAQQQFNNQANLVLPSSMNSAPLSPFQTAQNNLLQAQLGRALNPPAPNPNSPLSSSYMPSIAKNLINSIPSITNPLSLSTSRMPSIPKTFGAPLTKLSNTTAASPSLNIGMFSGSTNPSMSAVPGLSIIPTAQQLTSVVGINQLLQYLNKINPITFNSQTLLSAPKSLIMQAIDKLPYNTLMQIFLMLPVEQRAQLIMLDTGIADYGEALLLAEGYSAYLPPLLSALQANQAKKKIAESAQLQNTPQVKPKVVV